jgi:hypothetical protein
MQYLAGALKPDLKTLEPCDTLEGHLESPTSSVLEWIDAPSFMLEFEDLKFVISAGRVL